MTWSVFLWEGWEGDAAALPTQSGLWEGGRERTSAPCVWSAPRHTPCLVLPWGWLSSCTCRSPLLLPVPWAVSSFSQWLFGWLWVVFGFWAPVSSCLIGNQVMKSCSAAASRPWEDPGQQQGHPCRTLIFGCSVSLSRDNPERDARRRSL